MIHVSGEAPVAGGPRRTPAAHPGLGSAQPDPVREPVDGSGPAPVDEVQLLWARHAGGMIAVHGEVDMSTRDLFAGLLDAAVRDAASGDPPRDDAHLDLRDLRFIDIGGARALVEAALKMPPGGRLIVHNPPRILLRVLEAGWDRLPAITFAGCPVIVGAAAENRAAREGTC